MDLATLIGLVVAIGGILLGNHLEGGHLDSIVQGTAALIVLGGCMGATMIGFPLSTSIGALKSVKMIFLPPHNDPVKMVNQILEIAQTVRKSGLLALQADVAKLENRFLRSALQMAVDGVDPSLVKSTMEAEIVVMEEKRNEYAKFWEAAGGYAPTIGIIGAVLGLIHVMSNLSDTSKLGAGIAAAFVATIYGVGSANIFFLPFANKLKILTHHEVQEAEMILEGVNMIQVGHNIHIIRRRLAVMLDEKARAKLEE